MTDWQDLPEGIFAVHDPRNPDRVIYWRRRDTRRGSNIHASFAPWPSGSTGTPLKARNGRGPRLVGGYLVDVVEAIAADPVTAQRRFSDLMTACCFCGKGLTDDRSKTYGIGPECRKGIPAEMLTRYFTPEVGRAHAAQLAERNEDAR